MTQQLRQTRRSLPIALLRARETVMRPIRSMLQASGVNEQKWRVLRVLAETGPLELSQVAQEASLIVSSLTRMVPPMEAEGLISRRISPEDRRRSILDITDAGREILLRHAAQSNEIFERLAQEFGAEKLDQLLNLLEELQSLDLSDADQGNAGKR